jgi:hypothetical protein
MMEKAQEQNPGMTAQELGWKKMRAEEKDIRAIINRKFSASLMNNTKWAELVNALCDLHLMFTIQFVDVEQPLQGGGFWSATPRYWDGPFGPFLTLSIEWLDINPIRHVPQGRLLAPKRIDHTDEVEDRLQRIHVPYRKEGQHIRVTGHVRKATEE